MRLLTPVDPLEVGEIDTFLFDFTPDVGASFMLPPVPGQPSVTCRLTPFSPGSDPDPQSRVANDRISTIYQIRGPDDSIQTKVGAFALADIGPLPASAAGATYILDAVAVLSDGRRIALNSTVQCVLPGQ